MTPDQLAAQARQNPVQQAEHNGWAVWITQQINGKDRENWRYGINGGFSRDSQRVPLRRVPIDLDNPPLEQDRINQNTLYSRRRQRWAPEHQYLPPITAAQMPRDEKGHNISPRR